MSEIITVHLDQKPIYDIVIEKDFSQLGTAFSRLNVTGRKICIVTDSNVGPLYAKAVQEVLETTGNQIFVYTFAAGEESKNLNTVQDLYEFLIENHFDRKDMLAALGGGVVGDLTGFTAATYLRGISFIQIPTSLLAQVDSSIGGKTGVDFRAYKNMVGAFHQPKLVYMNMSTLLSLDTRLFNSGFGEIIKHGDRALLNFGHTLGHAIEKLMNFQLYHGECVVLGMIAALNISVTRGHITQAEYDDAIQMFKDYAFPTNVTGISIDDVIRVSKSDKKMEANQIKFILLKQIGNAYIDRTVTDDEMKRSLTDIIR